ncbi:MAG: flippase-like domain-containing protein [Caldisericaceae bacterium]
MKNEIFDKKALLRDLFLAIIASLVGIIFVSLFTHNWNFIELFKSFKPSYIVIAFLLMLINWLLESYTIKIIGSVLGYKITFREALRVFLIGGFFSRITPFGGGGGEPVQIIILSTEKKIPPGDSTAIISIKMFIGTFVRVSVFLFVPIWILIAKHTWTVSSVVNVIITIGIVITLTLFIFLTVFIFKPELSETFTKNLFKTRLLKRLFKEQTREKTLLWLDKIVKDFSTARNKLLLLSGKFIYIMFLVSFISWGIILLTPVILMRGLGITSPWPEIVITAVIFYISEAYIPTPGGSGTAELEMFALFARLIPNPLIGTFVIVWRFFNHYFLLIIGGLTTFFSQFMIRKSKPRK